MIAITSIIKQPDNSWRFQWTGADPSGPYKVVLSGEVLTITSHNTFTYDGVGYFDYPPPLEIVLATDFADTENNPPFVLIQWYTDEFAANYEVQLYVTPIWSPIFDIAEIGSQVYTYSTGLLVDGVYNRYQVVAYNSVEDASSGREYIVNMVTCPVFVESAYEVDYDDDTQKIILHTAS